MMEQTATPINEHFLTGKWTFDRLMKSSLFQHQKLMCELDTRLYPSQQQWFQVTRRIIHAEPFPVEEHLRQC